MKKEENKFITKRKWNKFKDISANKTEVLALVLFILSIFLLDVNANIKKSFAFYHGIKAMVCL